MGHFKTISFHLSKDRKREPSLAPALAGLVLLGALVFVRPSEEVGSFPPLPPRFTEQKLRLKDLSKAPL